MRVLVADPDESFLEILQSYLWDRGHETEVAANGLECLAMLRDFSPEVVVLESDMLWGGCDGVLARMADDAALAQVPTFVVSDRNPLEEFNRHFSTAPLAGWLRKPYRLADLLACVESAGRASTPDKKQDGETDGLPNPPRREQEQAVPPDAQFNERRGARHFAS